MRALGKSEAVINVIGSCLLYIARSVPTVVLCFVEVPVADKYDEQRLLWTARRPPRR